MRWEDLIRRSAGLPAPSDADTSPNPPEAPDDVLDPSPALVDPFEGHVASGSRASAPLAAGIEMDEPEHENPDALIEAEFRSPPMDPGTKPPGPPSYVDLDDAYPMRRVPTRWEQRQTRQNIEWLRLSGGGGGGGGSDLTLRPDIDKNTAGVAGNASDISDLQAEQVVQDDRLAAIEATPPFDPSALVDKDAEQDGRLDTLEATDPYDDAGVVARLDGIDAEQVTQDDAISATSSAVAAEKSRNDAQDGRLSALEAGGGGGGPGYDDTEVRGLISDNADGVAQNASDIGDNESRLNALEAVPPYDDTAVRGLISDNADGVAANAGGISDLQAEQVTQDAAIAKVAADAAKALTDHDKNHKAHPTLSSTDATGMLNDADGNPRVGRVFNIGNYLPVGFSSTGSYKPVISVLCNEQGAPSNRAVSAEIHADGKIMRFKKLDEALISGQYVWKEALDEAIAAIDIDAVDLGAQYNWSGPHSWARTGADNTEDWIIYGRNKDNPTAAAEKLLYVFRNVSGTPDAVNYMGKDDNNNNLANVGRVRNLLVPIEEEIDQLKADLADAISGAVTQRSWEYTQFVDEGIQDGKFWAPPSNDWNRVTGLRISDKDSGGKSFPVDLLNDGDVLEMRVMRGGIQQGRGVLIIDTARVIEYQGDRAVDLTVAGWSIQEGRPPDALDSCLFSWTPSTSEFATEAYVDAQLAALDIPDHPQIVNIEYEARYLGMNSGAWGSTLADGNQFAAYQPSNATTPTNWWGNMAQFRFSSNTGDVPKTLTTTTGITTGEIIISETVANGGGIRWKGGASWGHKATVERWRDHIIWFHGGHKVSGHGDQAVIGRDYHISVIGYPLLKPVR